MKTRLALLLLCSVLEWAAGCQYLSFSPQHTMCLRRPACPIGSRGVFSRDIQTILNEHNKYRQRVALGGNSKSKQPTAANMRQMEWDNELTDLAQKWAEQCKMQHDCNNCRKLSRFLVGQNLFKSWSTVGNSAPEWEKAILAWYQETSIFPPNKIQPFQNPGAAGNYTQVAWADSYKIGCGYAAYNQTGSLNKLYVCNYGPSGNMIGGKMYVKGRACSACPQGTTCSRQYIGLCTGGGGNRAKPKRPWRKFKAPFRLPWRRWFSG